MKSRTILVCLAGAIVLGGACCWFLSGGDEKSGEETGRREKRPAKIREAVRRKGSQSAKTSKKAGKNRPVLSRKASSANGQPARGRDWELDDFDDVDHPYSPEDKKVALELQKSLDALGEFTDEQMGKEKKPAIPAAKAARERFLAAFARASKSSNPSVRRACVDAGSWCGAEMIPELTPLMADPDAEVADAAVDAVQESLDDIGSASLQFEAAAAYMKTFSVNEDALEMFSSTLVSAATDLVDPADDSAGAEATALANRNWVVEVLTDLVENGSGKCVETAKGAYEEITSEEWVNAGEAQKWAADPENYEAPEMP